MAGDGRDRVRHHALPGRGRALPPPRPHPRRPAGRAGHGGRAQGRCSRGRAVLEVACPRVAGGARRAGRRSPGCARSRSSARACTWWWRTPRTGGAACADALAAAGNAPAHVERIVPSLEDVFIHYVEEAEAARRGGRRARMRKIWAVARKELRQIARDPLSLIMLARPARVHARAVRLRAQLRRAPRGPGRPGPRQDARPAATCVASFVQLDLLRPRGRAGRRRRPRAPHRARARPRRCWSSPRATARDLAAGRHGAGAAPARRRRRQHRARPSSATRARSWPRPTRGSCAARWPARARRRRAGIDYEPRVCYNPELQLHAVPGARPHRLPADADRGALHRALGRAREGARHHGAAPGDARCARAS